MKVFVAKFSAECNEHIHHIVTRDDFHITFEQESIDGMHVRDIFENEGIEIIPSISAVVHPNGMIGLETFNYIKHHILDALRQHVHEIDGVYLQFHGASGVKGLDCVSGEHDLMKEIRAITGKYMPIAMVLDPHGNLTNELAEQLNIVRCYRESPHSDTVDTQRKVATLLVDLMKNKRVMHPIVKKLPIMVGGERSVSAKEPVCSINRLLDEAEQDPRVFSTSFHVGFIRHDDDKLGAAITVIPNTEKDRDHCEHVANQISQYVWDHRHEFKFSGNFDEVKESIEQAIAYPEKTVVITDSGDNCGAGGYGQNTIVLREFLKHKTDKKVLFAGINDAQAFEQLKQYQIGDHFSLDLGIHEDEGSAPVTIHCSLKTIGEQVYGNHQNLGEAYVLNVDETNIDIIVMNHNVQYGHMEQFDAAKTPFHDYDIVIVKMGYLDTYLIPETNHHIMALSDGPTIQRSERIPFKKIARPMWPIDEFDELYYIH